jgi:Leucine-rich repeat (LRR) protein
VQEGCGGLIHESIQRPQAPEKSITKDMVISALEKQNIKFHRDAEVLKLLSKQTHLHMNAHNITHVGRHLPKLMKNLEVLYLYDNSFSCMDDFTGLQSLTHLYLQNNNIECIQGLSGLVNLSKLYLQVSA